MTKHEAICTLSLMATELVGELAGTDSDESNAKLLKRYIDSVNMAISALRQQETVTNRNGLNEPLTNAQKIRSMTDEELSEFLIDLANDGNLRIREWLQQPAEEDDHVV